MPSTDPLDVQEAEIRGRIEQDMQRLATIYGSMHGVPQLRARGQEGLRRLGVARGYFDGSLEVTAADLQAADVAARERTDRRP